HDDRLERCAVFHGDLQARLSLQPHLRTGAERAGRDRRSGIRRKSASASRLWQKRLNRFDRLCLLRAAMKCSKRTKGVIVGFSILAVSAVGFGKPAFMDRYNNDPYAKAELRGRCTVCHIGRGGGERNDFGEAFEESGYRITPKLRSKFPALFETKPRSQGRDGGVSWGLGRMETVMGIWRARATKTAAGGGR